MAAERAYADHYAAVHASGRARVRLRWNRLSVLAHAASFALGGAGGTVVGIILPFHLARTTRTLIAIVLAFITYFGVLLALALHREAPQNIRGAFD